MHDYEGLYYDASDVQDLKRWNHRRLQPTPPGLLSQQKIFHQLTGPDFVRATFRSLSVGSGSRAAHRYIEPVLRERERNGWGDFFYLNGLDPSGIGCVLGISDSTVRVLIARAIGKLGVRSRSELLSLPPFQLRQ